VVLSDLCTESPGRPIESIIGISNQGGAFYRDVPAGWYHITVDSYGRDLCQLADVALASGQQIYIEVLSLRSWTEWRPGVGRDTLSVALIRSELARAEIAGYVLLGGG
jgi:hypothetical protein